ncbi:ABC transporter permease [Paraburkholderia sp. ZP32-5]|uniref:ABC transporter permease n=1 Tax=Paraburkholderia sp. ZP32-5 TaxID=2883245 RepID=UPI001F4735CC|nr:ABC transporter permease [Paraburkholderia sp. ZP32-5]
MSPAFMIETFRTLLGGVPLTLNLTFVSVSIGFAGALLLTLARLSAPRTLGWPVRAYVFVFRGTPLLIQIFLIYYGLGQFRPLLQDAGLWPFFREPYWCAILALSMNTAAYGSEIIRGGLRAMPPGALEAAAACGMSRAMRWRRVTLPLAFRQALPAYGNELILMVKGTSLASIITIMEVTGLAQKLISETYRSVEVFVCAGVIYLALNFVLSRIVYGIEAWLWPDRRQAARIARITTQRARSAGAVS